MRSAIRGLWAEEGPGLAGLHASLQWPAKKCFNAMARRAGLPPDVAALVEQLSADSATLTLVNINPIDARTLIVQAGAYGEHQFESATIDGQKFELSSAAVPVRIEPGCGALIRFRMARYKNQPTLAQPWDRN